MTSQALSPTSGTSFRLYDSHELLNMESKVASGYLIILGGDAAQNNQTKLDPSALNLAFLALVEGNVVEACFGAKAHNAATPRTDRASQYANQAKQCLNDAVRSSDAIREITVKAYGQAFHVILQFNTDVKKLNFFTRCFRWKPLRQKAEADLVAAFEPLNEAIAASS